MNGTEENDRISIPGYTTWYYRDDRQYISDYLQPAQSDHKFNVSFWKTVLVWLEGRPEESKERDAGNLLNPLSGTIVQVYLEQGMQYDSGLLKLTKFHLAAFLKLLKMSPNESKDPHLAVLKKLIQIESNNKALCELRNTFKAQLLALLPKTTELQCDFTPEFLLIRELEAPDGEITTAFTILCNVRDPTFKVSLGARSVTLIHYAIIQMSSLCLSISSAQELETLEKVLVGEIQRNTSPLSTLVAGDILVYLARLAPPEYVTGLLEGLGNSSQVIVNRLKAFTASEPRESGDRMLEKWNRNQCSTGDLLKALPQCTNLLPLLDEILTHLIGTPCTIEREAVLTQLMDIILGCLRSIEGNKKGHNGLDVVEMLGRVVAGVTDDVIDGAVCDVILCYAKQKSSTNAERYCSRFSLLLSSLLDRQSHFMKQKILVTLAYLARVTPYPNIIRDLPVKHKNHLKTFLSRRGHETGDDGRRKGGLPVDQFKPASHGTRLIVRNSVDQLVTCWDSLSMEQREKLHHSEESPSNDGTSHLIQLDTITMKGQ